MIGNAVVSDVLTTRFDALLKHMRSIYGDGFIPLHRPVFEGRERQYLVECIDSNFVSSVGAKVVEFEDRIAAFLGSRKAIATVNGTAALHLALEGAGVRPGDEVVGQALTFIATCNAIKYIGARPVFVDVDRDTMGLSPDALRAWLQNNARMENGQAYNISTGARIAACVPMHTFGIPLRIAEIARVCEEFGIVLFEDAAESLGSYVGERHTGTFGKLAAISFNGNKVITTGGGGMIVTDDEELAAQLKHKSTTAKIPHAWDFVHDEVGYNYRLPNLNAALGCAQMEVLPSILQVKGDVAETYRAFCNDNGWQFVEPPKGTRANNWLNAVILENRTERDAFLDYSNKCDVMTRPVWTLMSELQMFEDCQHDGLINSRWLADRLVNLPSSVPERDFHRITT